MDLYGSEGLWYEKINWFMEQGKYPVKKIIQKKGDIVVSGPGTLHWVRSHGIALQSAWNQFPITLRMMEYAFCRQEENQRINFIRSNTIPLKMLTLKLLNHQPPQLTAPIQRLCVQKVKMWIRKEQDLFNELYDECEQFPFGQPRSERLEDLQGFCTRCRQQILIYFVNGKKVEDILCLACYKKEYKNRKKNKRVYMRHSLFDLNLLVRKSEAGKPFTRLRAFVSQYVGKVPGEIKNYVMDKQSVLIGRINEMNQSINKCDSKKLAEYQKNLKNKRVANDEKEDQKPTVVTEKPEPMDLQVPKEIPQVKNTEDSSLRKGFDVIKTTYLDRPSPSGWNNIKIPEHLQIVTEHNHVELLKLIYREEGSVIQKARTFGRPRVTYPFYVIRSDKYDANENLLPERERPFRDGLSSYRSNNFSSRRSFEDDPKFSDDEEQPTDKIKKKVHKNQDAQNHQESAKPQNDKNYELSSKIHETRKIRARDQSSDSKNSKKKHKKNQSSRSKSHDKKKRSSRSKSHEKKKKVSRSKSHDKKKKSSRSKSHDKKRKQHKKSRSKSKSPKSSKQSKSKQKQSRRSPSGSRRSRHQSHREEQISSRHSGSQKQSFRTHDERRDRNFGDPGRNFRGQNFENRDDRRNNGYRRDRDDFRGNNQGPGRNDNWRDSRKMNGGNDQWNNSNGQNDYRRDSGYRNDLQRGGNFERRDNYDGGFRGGNNYKSGRQNNGGDFERPRRFDSNGDNSRPFNNNRFDSRRDDKGGFERPRHDDLRNVPREQNQEQQQSNKIIEEKHETNDFEY